MNSRDVIKNLIMRKPAERYGVFEHFWPETIEGFWEKQGYPKGADATDHFNLDIMMGGGIDSAPLRGVWEVIEQTDEWEAARNGNGAILKHWKHKSGTPEHIAF